MVFPGKAWHEYGHPKIGRQSVERSENTVIWIGRFMRRCMFLPVT